MLNAKKASPYMSKLGASRRAKLAVIAVLSAASGAAAQPAAEDEAKIEALRQCAAIPTDGERLACYDAQVGAVFAAVDDGELTIVTQAEVDETKRSLFGLRGADSGVLGRGKETTALSSTVTSVNYFRRDAFRFVIEEGGAVWQVTNAPMKIGRIKPGDRVEIEKAALGSYWVRFNGRNGVKGSRVQ